MAFPAVVTVRDIRDPAELRACQALQRRTWGITEDGYVVPVATMAAAQKVGGSVLGAFDDDDKLLGFTFAFLGRLHGRQVLYSQLAAVDPDRQGLGIGRKLKLGQRARAQEMGLEAVVWAFDPLQASNAFFNLGVLGATCRTYEVDLYGSRSDALNAGLATDRLMAEWPTNPTEAVTPERPQQELIDARERDGVREPVAARDATADWVSLEIPQDLVTAKRAPSVAQAWQRYVRQAFQQAFAAGFEAVGFSREDPRRPRYLLHRRA